MVSQKHHGPVGPLLIALILSFHSNSIHAFLSSTSTLPTGTFSQHSVPMMKHSATNNLNNKNEFILGMNNRRSLLLAGAGAGAGNWFGNVFGGDDNSNANFNANAAGGGGSYKSAGPTNEVVKVVNGMKRRRLGGSDILVSELGLGTQRWCSTDFNAPNEEMCFEFMDEAILKNGVNLIDTAEQYPIPSGGNEGYTETVIGKWMKDRKVPRKDVVIASKITGGRNVTPKNIRKDCEGSLKRLGTDYLDVYQLHWPARYSPQANWGQSMKYNLESDADPYWRRFGGPTSFEELCVAMEDLIQRGLIRGWGLCNDNAYGLAACTRTAKFLGCTPPCSIQGDFSLVDRKVRNRTQKH